MIDIERDDSDLQKAIQEFEFHSYYDMKIKKHKNRFRDDFNAIIRAYIIEVKSLHKSSNLAFNPKEVRKEVYDMAVKLLVKNVGPAWRNFYE